MIKIATFAGEVELSGQDEATYLATMPQPTLDDLKSARIAKVDAKAELLLGAGYPFSADQHIALTDGSRTDLGAMATTAALAVSGAVPWPESYQQGWITIENTRIPLPTPADGIALAAPVGAFYGALKQHGRSLKDTILATTDEASLAAIDIESGWPA